MESIQSTLNLVPVPGLSFAFAVFRTIYDAVMLAEENREQLMLLSETVATILRALDEAYRERRLDPQATQSKIIELNGILADISAFVQRQQKYNFLRHVFLVEQTKGEIKKYQERLEAAIKSFQVSSLINIQRWQYRSERAMAADRKALNDRLNSLQSNQDKLVDLLTQQRNQMEALMVAFQRRLVEGTGTQEDLSFFNTSLSQLQSITRKPAEELPEWMVSVYDVELGALLGAGGFSQVYRGTWKQMEVAVKVMKNQENVSPNKSAIRKEIKAWSKLRHPHILQFLGANVFDDEPFILMPLVGRGNAKDWIEEHPDCDRVKYSHHIALGLAYLHSKSVGVIHGDLKAVNVLIDDGDRAMLCDFGLARIKAEVNTRTSPAARDVVGSQNWMAPECLRGSRPTMSSDVYAFGMTMYEMFTGEIPMGYVQSSTLYDLVVQKNTRPDKPTREEAPALTEDLWALIEQCWVDDKENRPPAEFLCAALLSLMDQKATYATKVKMPKPAPSVRPAPSGMAPWPSQPAGGLRQTDSSRSRDSSRTLVDSSPVTSPVSPLGTTKRRPAVTPMILPGITQEQKLKFAEAGKKAALAKSGSDPGPQAHATSQVHTTSQPRLNRPSYTSLSQLQAPQSRPPDRIPSPLPPPSRNPSPLPPPARPPVAYDRPWPQPQQQEEEEEVKRHESPLSERDMPSETMESPHEWTPYPSSNPSAVVPQPISYSLQPIPQGTGVNGSKISSLFSRLHMGGPTMKRPFKAVYNLSNPSEVRSLAISPDGKTLAAGLNNGRFEVWDINKKCMYYPVTEMAYRPRVGEEASPITAITYSTCVSKNPSSHVFGLGTLSGNTGFFRVDYGSMVLWSQNRHPVRCVFAADDKVLVLNTDAKIFSWLIRKEATERPRITELRELYGLKITCGAFSMDGKTLFVGTDAGSLFVLDSHTGRSKTGGGFLMASAGQPGGVRRQPSNASGSSSISCKSIAPSPDGRKVAMGYSNGEIRLWDASRCSYDVLRTPGRGKANGIALTYSPDGTRVAYISREAENTIDIQEVASLKVIATVHVPHLEGKFILTMHIIQNNKKMVMTFKGSPDIMVCTWN